MLRYIVKRIVSAIPVFVTVTVAVFFLLYLAPGDPAALIAGDTASPAEIERVRSELGLDQPVWSRFLIWAAAIASGDLGQSIFTNLPVADLIAQRIEPTLSLAICGMLFATFLAIPLGMIAASNSGRLVDRLVMGFAALGFSVPSFVLSYVLVLVFSLHFQLLPVQGFKSISTGFGPFLASMALPSMAVGLSLTALLARITRARMIEVLQEDYIRTATAKGLSRSQIMFRHGLRNAMVQIVTVMGSGVALLIGGAIVVETVFAIPGLGRLTVDAVVRRDYPVVQGVVLLFSFSYVLINLAVDILYAVIDPRIRYS